MAPLQPKSPVLTFSQGYMEPVSTEGQIMNTNKTALKRGWFKKMVVIDSACRRFPVIRVEERGSDGPFWGLSLMHGRKVRVELFYGEPEQLSLGEVQELVCKAIRRDASFYEASEYSLDELQQGIRMSASFEEMFQWID